MGNQAQHIFLREPLNCPLQRDLNKREGNGGAFFHKPEDINLIGRSTSCARVFALSKQSLQGMEQLVAAEDNEANVPEDENSTDSSSVDDIQAVPANLAMMLPQEDAVPELELGAHILFVSHNLPDHLRARQSFCIAVRVCIQVPAKNIMYRFISAL